MSGSYRMWLVSGWDDPWFEHLDSAHKIAFMYLVLGPNSRPSGLYVQSVRQMSSHLNTDVERVEAVLADFDRDGKVHRDADRGVVWVVNKAAQSELAGMGPGVRKSIEKDLRQHARSPLVARFFEVYPTYRGGTRVVPESYPGGTGVVPRSDMGTTPVVPNQHQDQGVNRTTTKNSSREPDECWDALIEELGLTPDEITPGRRGRLNKALKEIRAAGGTGEEIHRRSRRYRQLHPEWEFTETALAMHWASLGQKKRRAPIEQLAEPEPEPLSAEETAANLARIRGIIGGVVRPVEEVA